MGLLYFFHVFICFSPTVKYLKRLKSFQGNLKRAYNW